MKKQTIAFALISLAFLSGMVLTAATSGCDSPKKPAETESADASSPDISSPASIL
ncbi:MAG: hypothetical protein R3C53_14035 [Pirellulaceae bacterium]